MDSVHSATATLTACNLHSCGCALLVLLNERLGIHRHHAIMKAREMALAMARDGVSLSLLISAALGALRRTGSWIRYVSDVLGLLLSTWHMPRQIKELISAYRILRQRGSLGILNLSHDVMARFSSGLIARFDCMVYLLKVSSSYRTPIYDPRFLCLFVFSPPGLSYDF